MKKKLEQLGYTNSLVRSKSIQDRLNGSKANSHNSEVSEHSTGFQKRTGTVSHYKFLADCDCLNLESREFVYAKLH